MMHRITFTILLSIICFSCKGQGSNPYASAEPIRINRFDKALFEWIEEGDASKQTQLLAGYPAMVDITGKAVLNLQSTDMPGFFDRLMKYYSEPTLKGVYRDALNQYESVSDIEQQLGSGFAYLKANLPSLPIPVVYMHVSGFGQNILVAENLLSVSIDKYIGKDYPLYEEFFYDYQREKMQRLYIVPDYLAGWLMSEYTFTGKENVLLDRMVYEGKIKYLVAQAVPEIAPYELMGYTKEQYEWCKDNEGVLWKTIIENKHLYTPDHVTTNKYFEEMPDVNFVSEAPGNLGVWLGWQIVTKYMKEMNVSPEVLMQQTNAQDVLTASKYKPF